MVDVANRGLPAATVTVAVPAMAAPLTVPLIVAVPATLLVNAAL